MPLEKGTSEDVTALPRERHSGVWVDRQAVAHIMLKRRKHRQRGSLVSRPCTCQSPGLQCCPPHRLVGFLLAFESGDKLWGSHSAHQIPKMLQSQLTFFVGRESLCGFSSRPFGRTHNQACSQGLLGPGDLSCRRIGKDPRCGTTCGLAT